MTKPSYNELYDAVNEQQLYIDSLKEQLVKNRALVVQNSISIKNWHILPDGVHVVEVECHDAKEFLKLPAGIVYSNRNFGKTGWNSDHNVCYYRTDKSVAFSN